jgi:hypothetical protein
MTQPRSTIERVTINVIIISRTTLTPTSKCRNQRIMPGRGCDFLLMSGF